MSKLGLVLEGGGMRGAYTAGVLAWLIDNNIVFDYGVGISAGAVTLCCYELKDKKLLHDISVKYMSDKHNVGLIPLLKEGRYVGYNYMFDYLLKDEIKLDIAPIKKLDSKVEIGLYDLNECKTSFYDIKDFDDNLRMLKASCTLPIAGHIVDYNGHRFLDGGITVMIPIEQSLANGVDKNLVIITKPEGYVRKPAGSGMRNMMKFNYPKYPEMVEQYSNRHLNYEKQMSIIDDEVAKGKALVVRPSINIPVKRFSGDPENLKKLYDLGYKDMEDRSLEILEFLKGKD